MSGMSPDTTNTPDATSNKVMLELLTSMVRIRSFEERVGELFLKGQSAGTMLHLSIGEEGAAAGVGLALQEGDSFTTHHRGHGIFLARGADPNRMMAEIAGKASGYCRGKGGSMHIADMQLGHLGANAIVGGGIPTVVGAALSYKTLEQPHVSAAFFGDGALQQGILYEAMNLAALWNLPAAFICVNNQYGMGTRIDQAAASLDFTARAKAFGLTAASVSGEDARAVYQTATDLLDVARQGTPVFLEVSCYRFHGHARKDKSPYRDAGEEALGRTRDPIARARDSLIATGNLTQIQFDAIQRDADSEMDAAISFAEAAEPPTLASMFEDVYAPTATKPAPVVESWQP
ncbi:MAG: thiamine pyrophosphate-dependent dehydrogenase E1 component subunit alpha [Deinococcota bacterium]